MSWGEIFCSCARLVRIVIFAFVFGMERIRRDEQTLSQALATVVVVWMEMLFFSFFGWRDDHPRVRLFSSASSGHFFLHCWFGGVQILVEAPFSVAFSGREKTREHWWFGGVQILVEAPFSVA